MTDNPKHPKVEAENKVPKEIADLVAEVGQLPDEYRARIEPVLSRVVESNRRRRRIVSLVQDALSQLRLDMKYLMFDVEATRRERDGYKSQLDDQ